MVRRNYIATSDVSGATEAQVGLAEEIIDQYVGFQDRHVNIEFRGQLTAVSGTTLTDNSNFSQLRQRDGYFNKCVIEIVGGAGIGQTGIINASSYDNRSITLATAFGTTPDTTSFYRIYQLAKFPRVQDTYNHPNGLTYYKTLPQAVVEATKAQVEYIIAQGNDFFTDDSTDVDSESIGNYSYSGGTRSAAVKMVAPKARLLLRGIMNRTGQINVDC